MGIGVSAWVVATTLSIIFGLIVGSFLNVVIYRVPRHESILRPPSHCPACDTQLAGRDLVPVVSWVALRGRCRHCRAPISIRYPLVEFLTAATLGGLSAALRWSAPLPSLAVVVCTALAAVVIDADGLPVPWPVASVGALAALSLGPVAGAVGYPGRAGWAALGGILAGAAAVVVDRSRTPATWPFAVIVATLGWSAGWLWPPGGPLCAGWILVAGAATLAGAARRPPLALVGTGMFALVLTGAVLGRP